MYDNKITVEVNPSFVGAAEVPSLNKNDGSGIVLALHGGSFSLEDVEHFFKKNGSLRFGVRMGEDLRLASVLINGAAPSEKGEENFLSIHKGDRVIVFRDYQSAKEFSLYFPEEKVIVLDTRRAKDPKDPSYEVYIPEIVFGHNDSHLVLDRQDGKRNGDKYVVKRTASGKIFDHEEVMYPNRITEGNKVLTPKDIDILRIIKQYREQVTGIEVSILSSSYDVRDLYDALKEIFGGDFPEITFRIENMSINADLELIFQKFKSLEIKPKIVIGYERLRLNIIEEGNWSSYWRDKFGQYREIDFVLTTEVRRILSILSEAGIKEACLDWGLVTSGDITAKIRETVSLEIESGIKLHYWISRPTIGMSKGAEVIRYLEGTRELRREVIKGLLTELTGNVAGSNI